MSVFRVFVFVTVAALGVLAMPGTASAQYTRRPATQSAAVGEDYHIEAAYNFWNAEPSLIVNSESLGILGTDVDLINDLGIQQKRLGVFDLVLKPSKKHRFKYQHLPIEYSTDAFPVKRSFVFNGQRYNVGVPVTTAAMFSTDAFAYEYDFLYFNRGFIGANLNVKMTHVNVDLRSPIGREYFEHAVPIPAYGFAGRAYVTANIAVDGAFTFFRIPDSLKQQLNGDGSYNDFDLHGTYNITRNAGAQFGWRKTTVFYKTKADVGNLAFHGLFFGGVVRY